jgi:hypothetical protein
LTTTAQPLPLPPPTIPWFDPNPQTGGPGQSLALPGGLPTKEFALYLASLDTAIRTLCGKI